MAQRVKNLPAMQEIWDQSLGWEDPPEEEMNGDSLQDSCLGNFHGQRSPVGCSPRGRKESDTTERLSTYKSKLASVCLQGGACTN